MPNKIDHIVVGAADLDQGVAALATTLGVTVPRGSRHEAMGTHNCVMQVGGEGFLEILAIDPDGPAPRRARWFSLDDPATRARLAVAPRALCWVVGTDDLDGVLAARPVPLGEVVPCARGDRTWRLTVPRDGSLPASGLLPAFIEWSPGRHPSLAMADLGVSLRRVDLTHPDPSWLAGVLQHLGIDHLATVAAGPPALSFTVTGPRGPATLS